MKLQFKWRILKHDVIFRVIRKFELDENVVGINSNLNSGDCHVLMIDYDTMLKHDALISEIQRLQKKFSLDTCHIFESSFKHYFVFFFNERMRYVDCLEILRDTPCCQNFKSYRMLRDEMTLRLTPKKGYEGRPKLVHIVENKVKNSIHIENKDFKSLVFQILNVTDNDEWTCSVSRRRRNDEVRF